ncbi:hypothetical protein KIN20_015743 [Parelaphostrongylus tenuis]|uniref:Uncharacterized protein n=1 Tax=Parelaphostrongylus tenuis TaxID=148309 RepID=A0AAD5N4H9_PARTN|nr:hypothetical protein KIN20_015743 [Parelaphostrongylus tenuis]
MGDRLMRSIEDSVMASGVIVADGDDVIVLMIRADNPQSFVLVREGCFTGSTAQMRTSLSGTLFSTQRM